MTMTALATTNPDASLEHVGPQVLPSRTLKYLDLQAKVIASSPLAGPYKGKPNELLPVLVRGAELGLQPMTSIEYLYVIEDRVYPATKLVGALFRRAGHWYRVIEESEERCVIRARHRGDREEDTLTMTFTVEQARKLGVLDVTWKRWYQDESGRKRADVWVEGSDVPRPGWAKAGTKDVTCSKKDNWHKDTAGMLFYRCLRRACERIDPGVLMALGDGPFLEDATSAYVSPESTGVIDVDPSTVHVYEPPAVGDDEILDAEIEEWPETWAASCKAAKIDRATSCALLSYATSRAVSSPAEVTDPAERDAATRALDLLHSGELALVDGRIVEREAE